MERRVGHIAERLAARQQSRTNLPFPCARVRVRIVCDDNPEPAHMRDFKVLPNTRAGDNGGVHTNSGIHNKAAFNILTAVKGGALVFKPEDAAAFFYLALTQRLSRTSQFTDSRTAVLDSARTLFRNLAPGALDEKISAIEAGFTAVGIN